LAICWLADEDFNSHIVWALLRRRLDLDIVRVQDVGLSGIEDPVILAWAASEGRITLTHDVSTMTVHAYARVLAGEPMPGLFEVSQDASIAVLVKDILLLTDCSFDSEWEGQVRYPPLR
jgi:type IV secretory pathway TrbF-like protein